MQVPNQSRSYTIKPSVEDQFTVIHINANIKLTAEATVSLAKALQGEGKLDTSCLVDLFQGLTENNADELLHLADTLLLAASIIRSRQESF